MKYSKNILDLVQNYKLLNTNSERVYRIINSSITAFINPKRSDAVSELGDLSNMNTLLYLKQLMENSEAGSKILTSKPRITSTSLNMSTLFSLPTTTLGYHYYTFIQGHHFTPDERPKSKYIPDMELAYVNQRYKETHDFYHVLLGYDISVVEEIAVKWFEALHLRLPSASISSVFGQMRLSFSDQGLLIRKYIPHVKLNAEQASFMLNQDFEGLLDKDIDYVRKEMNIVSLKEFERDSSRLWE